MLSHVLGVQMASRTVHLDPWLVVLLEPDNLLILLLRHQAVALRHEEALWLFFDQSGGFTLDSEVHVSIQHVILEGDYGAYREQRDHESRVVGLDGTDGEEEEQTGIKVALVPEPLLAHGYLGSHHRLPLLHGNLLLLFHGPCHVFLHGLGHALLH